jgi:hypothetical protein
MMDYASRFGFHLFAPIFLFAVYLAPQLGSKSPFLATNAEFMRRLKIPPATVAKALLLIPLAGFALSSSNRSIHLVTYYPRLLDAHAPLGNILARIADRDGIRAFSFGDAGMTAYQSGLPALDNIGLGSTLVATRGIDAQLLEEYAIDLIVFHARPGGVRLADFNQEAIFAWQQENHFIENCDVYWQPDYTMRVFARTLIPEVLALCTTSKEKNAVGNREYLRQTISLPPWTYWRE